MAERQRRATIIDVAERAGVSKSLVSLAFSHPDQVSDKRRERILAAADELGFTPNRSARSLSAAHGNFVGILVEDLHNPLFAVIVDEIRAALNVQGVVAIVTAATLPGDLEIDKAAVAALLDLRPTVIVTVGSLPEAEDVIALAGGAPVVALSGVIAGLTPNVSIRPNESSAMRQIVAHLVAQGHQDIMYFCGPAGRTVGEERIAAYREVMKTHGLAQHVRVIAAGPDEESGYRAAQQVLDASNRPTAIACYNDLQALGVQRALIERGLDQSDVAVTGYDNTFISSLPQISLTTIEPQNLEIAHRAAAAILALASGSAVNDATQQLEPLLVVRGSTPKR